MTTLLEAARTMLPVVGLLVIGCGTGQTQGGGPDTCHGWLWRIE